MLDLGSLRTLYSESASPIDLADALASRIAASDDPAIFIAAAPREELRLQAEDLLRQSPEPNNLPLWGVPFAAKYNIDVAGFSTTAGCPSFAYTPERDALAVARLRAAGALVVGKTNLDQFATSPFALRHHGFSPR